VFRAAAAGTIFSAQPKRLLRAAGALGPAVVGEGAGVVVEEGLLCLDRSHEGSRAETRCMAGGG
jgi:hypothetical protein